MDNDNTVPRVSASDRPAGHVPDEEILIEVDGPDVAPPTEVPSFGPAPASMGQSLRSETRRVAVPPHRMSPLKKDWINIFGPLTEMLGLQVRMNVQRKSVEMRTSKHTKEHGALQKGLISSGHSLLVSISTMPSLSSFGRPLSRLVRNKDVKTLHGDHLSRAIGRIAGQDGKTKFTIENASRTRIILADTKIHILGSFQNIKIARDAIVSLILGSPPGKVYAGLRTVASRMKQRAL
ncbi:hypothetical protein BC826DRAFT_587101 [Russula brevipes]|nr:hypothetical protein BC826DRAFT_587101 [Russula brevipes]